MGLAIYPAFLAYDPATGQAVPGVAATVTDPLTGIPLETLDLATGQPRQIFTNHKGHVEGFMVEDGPGVALVKVGSYGQGVPDLTMSVDMRDAALQAAQAAIDAANLVDAPADEVVALLVGGSTQTSGALFQAIEDNADTMPGLISPVDRARAKTPEPHLILDLARQDGWYAVYDPTNPETIDVSGAGAVTALRDGLNQGPPMNIVGLTPILQDGLISGGTLASAAGSITSLTKNFGVLIECLPAKPRAGNQYLLSGNGASNRATISVVSSGILAVGNGITTVGEGYAPVQHSVIDYVNHDSEGVMCLNGQLSYRGRPGSALIGTPQNFRLGGFDTTTITWDGSYGIFAVHPNPTPEIMNRMRALIMRLRGITVGAPEHVAEVRTITVDSADNIVHCKGDPDLVSSSTYASMTKMLSWVVAREHISDADMNNVTVTIQSGDLEPYGEPTFQVGDVLTLRDLAVATALPSNNTTPRTLARYIAETYLPNPDSLPARKLFVAHVNDRTRAWGWTGANMVAPGGGMRASMRQVTNLLRRVRNDSVLGPIFGLRTATVTVTGPNARTIPVQHTIDSGTSTNTFSEFLTGKTGTSGGYAHVGAVWDHNGDDYISVITNLSTTLGEGRSRYTELFRAMQTAKNMVPSVDRANPGALFNFENSTGTLDITHLLSGVAKNGAYVESGVHLARTGHAVILSFFDVTVSAASPLWNAVLPYPFQPSTSVFGTVIDRDSGQAYTLAVMTDGRIQLTSPAGARLRGSITYMNLSRFPSPPYPGMILQDY